MCRNVITRTQLGLDSYLLRSILYIVHHRQGANVTNGKYCISQVRRMEPLQKHVLDNRFFFSTDYGKPGKSRKIERKN